MAIDFSLLFGDSDSAPAAEPTKEEARLARLKRDDDTLFKGKALHTVSLQLSMEEKASGEFDARTHLATRPGPSGELERIGVIFQGQRRDDLKSGALMAEMEAARQTLVGFGDYSDPSRTVEVVGAWKPRKWRDGSGKEHKAFDLVAASWSFVNQDGKQITEGHSPDVPSKEDQRIAAVREAAERKAADVASRKTSRSEDVR